MRSFAAALALFLLAGCAVCEGGQVAGSEPVVGSPCEGCEAVFQGIPSELSSAARIASVGEPGEPMRIEGRVLHKDGTPAPGIVVYAYHTNIDGIYPRAEDIAGEAADRHGALRGWVEAGEDGRFRFDTIRPAGYPRSDIPEHVHMHVIEPGRCTYYIDDIVFTDDPRLTPAARRQYMHGRGGDGIVTPQRGEDGVWLVVRDIILGEGIPGYPPPSPAE